MLRMKGSKNRPKHTNNSAPKNDFASQIASITANIADGWLAGQSNVDGAKLAAFIDAAVADSIRELEKREDDLSKAGVTMLENVDGKSMVKQINPQFLEFVLDAYRSLKYRK